MAQKQTCVLNSRETNKRVNPTTGLVCRRTHLSTPGAIHVWTAKVWTNTGCDWLPPVRVVHKYFERRGHVRHSKATRGRIETFTTVQWNARAHCSVACWFVFVFVMLYTTVLRSTPPRYLANHTNRISPPPHSLTHP